MRKFYRNNKQLISDIGLFAFFGMILVGMIVAIVQAIHNQGQAPSDENMLITALVMFGIGAFGFFFVKGDSNKE